MTIISIPIASAGSTVEIQTWLDANADKTISRIINVGNFWYIFYE